MLLKSIEIRGFKSFADKTELSFIQGITAVVGPNGSGKSNITDAVRWVLGEQSSKTLRGGKMEDVIFAGTQFRKPIGLAQVAITLDNSDGGLSIDYSDVKISRRLYRSGESEYYINNNQCRLKDVQELLMDTGIGKEGYSIIGQGKIDAILSGRPEERRSLLEEAAGIVKFKTRKEESERKLNNTKENLVRINDILSTYEERIEPLRLEQEKAKSFITLSAELKEMEINIIIYTMEKSQTKLAEYNKELIALKEKTEELTLEKSMLKQKQSGLTNELESFQEMLGSQREQYYENKNKEELLISDKKLILERIENINHLINKDKDEENQIQNKLQLICLDKNTLEEKVIELNNIISKLNDDLMKKNSKVASWSLSIEEISSNIENLKSEKLDLLSHISNSKNEILFLKNDIEIIESKREQLEIANDSYKNSIKLNDSTALMLENQLIKIKEQSKIKANEVNEINAKIQSLSIIINKDNTLLNELNSKITKFEANRSMLINLHKQFEGYNKAVKNIMQRIEANSIPNIKGNCVVLGEIIRVKKEFETAIEVSLGGSISNIITKDEAVAKTLIEYLKKNNMGRATFLPLNILKSKPLNINEDLKKLPGYIGIASELVEYDEKYIKAIEYTLGRMIIAKDMDSALKIAKACGFNNKIVTLTGEVLNIGGSLTGGSNYEKSVSIIGRKREIDELTTNLRVTEEKITDLKNLINSNTDKIMQFESSILNLKDEIHNQNIEITKVEGKISAINEDTKKLKKDMEISKEEINKLNLKFGKNQENLDIKKEAMNNLIHIELVNDKKIDSLEEEIKDITQSFSYEKEIITELKIKLAKENEAYLNKNSELERIKNEIQELNIKINTLLQEIIKNKTNLTNCNTKLKENEAETLTIHKLTEDIEKSFMEKEDTIIQLKNSIKANLEEIDFVHSLIENTEETIHKNELSSTKYKTEMETQLLKLNEELELTYAEAISYKVQIDSISEYKTKLQDIKNNIQLLGIVNVGSIEEYKNLIEHYSFMNEQRQDLQWAMDELISVIDEMTDKMRTIFNSNFKILKENFNDTFKELFKGGSADLILSEGDELNANIEINVQPPGKKLQNINLMSGGEKVLSAIALLFAILKMKPTPFCILDEIEAALDDANVIRYAEFLKKFSSTTQFIVITHRKGTMEASDIMYGVTMEEKGISKIVSVNLTN